MTRWPIPREAEGETVAVLASGPSMSQAVADQVRAAGIKAIAVNTTYRLAPWAWLLHAADARWWQQNPDALRFAGHKSSCEEVPGVGFIERSGKDGFDWRPGYIRTGGNSGYQAIHLAAQAGAARVLLCGMDFRKTGGESHWHGDHPAPLQNTDAEVYLGWLRHFPALVRELPAGCEVVNCTPGSAIDCFRRATLEEELARVAVPA